MRYADLPTLFRQQPAGFGDRPLALILAEDEVELASTLAHHLASGFRDIILLAPAGVVLSPDHEALVHVVRHDVHAENALVQAVNLAIDRFPGTWIYYCHNAEYLIHPFRETRRIGEMLAFHAEERRNAMLTYVIDLYAGDLAHAPNGVAPDDAWLDRTGYYTEDRKDPLNNWQSKERQRDIYGGLRWRFEEHIPFARRRIDRISLFRARRGLRLLPDFTLSEDEMNTYACRWHNNLTAAVCSFRTAKALRTNPGSRHAINSFRWPDSVKFEWTSGQLMNLGLIEPGQWF